MKTYKFSVEHLELNEQTKKELDERKKSSRFISHDKVKKILVSKIRIK